MATGKIGLTIWLLAVTLLWALYPLFLTPARGVLIFAMFTGVAALLGWLSGVQLLVLWSGILGLLNLTLALLLTAYPPSLWLGLSAGLTLLALLDGSQRFAYLRRCQIEAGVITTLFETFVRLSGLSVAVVLGLGVILFALGASLAGLTASGLLTIAGACAFVGFLAVFLLYASRMPDS